MATSADQPGLYERTAAMARLDTAIETAACGEGTFVAIEGDPGIGKTTLLGAAAARAREAGMLVLAARGNELETQFPFGLIGQCLEPVLRRCDASTRARLLSGAAVHAEAALGLTPALQVGESAEALFRALHGLYWLVVNLTDEHPVLLLLDDLQWADTSSLRFLDFLAGRLDDIPVAVIAATRSSKWAEKSALLARVVGRLAQPMIALQPLSVASVRRMVVDACAQPPDARFLAAVNRLVAGNPFFLVQFLAELRAQGIAPTAEAANRIEEMGSGSVSRIVTTRLGQLHHTAAALARAVSVLGGDASPDLARALAGIAQSHARIARDQLIAGLLLAPGEPLAFVHPIVRNAIYEDIGPADRSGMHRRAADLLSGRGASIDRVVAQLMVTDPNADPWVAKTFRAAALRARDRGAIDAAAAYLRRGLAEPPAAGDRLQVLRELAVTELRMGAPETLARARSWLSEAPDPAERAAAVQLVATTLTVFGEYGEAVDELDAERRALRDSDPALSAWLGAQAATLGPMTVEGARAGAALLRELPDRTGNVRTDRVVAVARAAYAVFGGEVHVEAAAAMVHAALTQLNLLDEADAPVLATALWCTAATEQLELMDNVLERSISEFRRQGSLFGVTRALHWRAYTHLTRGALAEAAEDARLVLVAAEENHWHLGIPSSAAFLIDALVSTGRVADAREELSAREHLVETPMMPSVMLQEARGRLRLAEGDCERALSDFLGAGRRFTRAGIHNPAITAWRSCAAEAAFRLGDRAQAQQLSKDELSRARRYGAARPLGVALRVAALCAADDVSIADLRESADTLRDSPATLVYATTLLELGAALRRHNHRVEARDSLGPAFRIASELGAAPLAERAHEEILATGARPRRLVLTGADALTASERRVARMAADGLSNPEIAQALFVTRKTVETHLSSTYRKLDISSRLQLAAALSR